MPPPEFEGVRDEGLEVLGFRLYSMEYAFGSVFLYAGTEKASDRALTSCWDFAL